MLFLSFYYLCHYFLTGLVKTYSSLILMSQSSYDLSLLFKVYGLLLKKASVQCNLDWNAIYKFFLRMADCLKLVSVESEGQYTFTININVRLIARAIIFFTVRME